MSLAVKSIPRVGYLLAAIVAASPIIALGAEVVQNGSLEDVNGSFVNTAGNYMALSAGATSIGGWMVSTTTVGAIVWAQTPTSDGYSASDGTFFADLSGFGSSSPNGAIEQTLHNLVIGQQYSFSIDTFVGGSQPIVNVGATTLSLSSGASHTVGSTTWTSQTATFTASASNPILTINNALTGQQISFIDNISVIGPVAAVPEPGTYAMMLVGLGLLGLVARRTKPKEAAAA